MRVVSNSMKEFIYIQRVNPFITIVLKIKCLTNRVDPDEMAEPSRLDLHCLVTHFAFFFSVSIVAKNQVERLFLTVPWGCLRFVIVVFPDHTHLLFLSYTLFCKLRTLLQFKVGEFSSET